MSVYYAIAGEPGTGSTDIRNMHVTMKVWRTKGVYVFSFISDPVLYTDYQSQFDMIAAFIQDEVMPIVLDCVGDQCPAYCQPLPEYGIVCDQPPYFSLKSVSDHFEDIVAPYADFDFMVFDGVLAVVD